MDGMKLGSVSDHRDAGMEDTKEQFISVSNIVLSG